MKREERPLRVIVCDDEDSQRAIWAERIGAIIGPENVQMLQDPVKQLQSLLARRYDLRQPNGSFPEAPPLQIDEADVLVVDYDLTLIDKDVRHTGEEIARLARMFSDCGYVIVMNQFPGVGFDLTLKGHLEQSYADLNIDAELVGRPALWSRQDGSEFAPWSWDNIAAITESRRKIADEVVGNLNSSVVDYLGIPREAIDQMADTAFGFLSGEKILRDDLKDTTFADFLAKLSEHKDLTALIEARPINAARTAVSRLGKWLSRAVLGPQDVLVDVPHLLVRMPYLISPELGEVKTIEHWNDALLKGSGAINPVVREASEFLASTDWIGKPTFWWNQVLNHELVDTLRDDYNYDLLPPMVFAEDASVFIGEDDAKPFRAGFHNFFDRRFVRLFDGVEYAPRRRLAFADY